MHPKILYINTSQDVHKPIRYHSVTKYVSALWNHVFTKVHAEVQLGTTEEKDDTDKNQESIDKTEARFGTTLLLNKPTHKDNKHIHWGKQGIPEIKLDKAIVGGGNGSVARDAFANLTNNFHEWAANAKQGKRIKFAVVDHNSAHHITYMLARHAFTAFGRDDSTKILINFDQHKDDGSYNSKNIACSTWGIPLLDKRSDDGVRCDGYAVIGVGRATVNAPNIQWNLAGTRLWTRSQGGKSSKTFEMAPPFAYTLDKQRKSAKPITYTDKQGVTKMLVKAYKPITPEPSTQKDGAIRTELQQLITNIIQRTRATAETETHQTKKPWSDIDVYVTVDRDVMLGSATAYNDGGYLPEDIRYSVKTTMSLLSDNGARLVGFDVTGLPNAGLPSKWAKSISKSDLIDTHNRAWDDITAFLQSVFDYRPPNPPTRKPPTLKELKLSEESSFHQTQGLDNGSVSHSNGANKRVITPTTSGNRLIDLERQLMRQKGRRR